jgi:hypothetical protein
MLAGLEDPYTSYFIRMNTPKQGPHGRILLEVGVIVEMQAGFVTVVSHLKTVRPNEPVSSPAT